MDKENVYTRLECMDCHRTFDRSEVKKIELRISKNSMEVCPYCKGQVRLNMIPEELDRYLYVNDDERYYIYDR